jgi:sugar phosphate isomerase/epimerase
MRLGICTGIDGMADAAAAGYDYVELAVPVLIADQDEAAFAPVRKSILDAPIPVEALNCFVPGHLRMTGPEVDLAAVRAHMDTALRRASEIGASIVVMGSGAARRAPDDFPLDRAMAQFVEAARMAGETAEKYGVTVALEPLVTKQCNFFNRVDTGVEIVEKVNHPRLRLLTDLFHFTAAGEPWENIVQAGARLAHTHLATPSIPETAEGEAYDFANFFAALAEAGYDTRSSVEDNPGLLRQAPGPRVEAYRAVREFVASFLPARV